MSYSNQYKSNLDIIDDIIKSEIGVAFVKITDKLFEQVKEKYKELPLGKKIFIFLLLAASIKACNNT